MILYCHNMTAKYSTVPTRQDYQLSRKFSGAIDIIKIHNIYLINCIISVIISIILMICLITCFVWLTELLGHQRLYILKWYVHNYVCDILPCKSSVNFWAVSLCSPVIIDAVHYFLERAVISLSHVCHAS